MKPSNPARTVLLGAAAVVTALAISTDVSGDTVVLGAVKDNTLYSNSPTNCSTDDWSNGSGDYLFAGPTKFWGIRRALLAFDIAGNVPAGSTIDSVELELTMSKTVSSGHPASLHRLLADWGEGASDAGSPGGDGTCAVSPDACWDYRMYPSVNWTNAGGDFQGAASATITVGAAGTYTWGSTAGMVADVQDWLDDPSTDFGWILIGNERAPATAKRYDSREHPSPGNRPGLTVTYTLPAGDAGAVPDGDEVPGTMLSVNKSLLGRLRLSWGASCLAGDTDYEVYEGTIGGLFDDHAPAFCTTSGATTSLPFLPAPGNTYYLVVPINTSAEGSYGRDSAGIERDKGSDDCDLPQVIGDPVCPDLLRFRQPSE